MYSNCQSLLANTWYLFSKIIEVFHEMEMEINAIDNEIFTKLKLNIRVRGNIS